MKPQDYASEGTPYNFAFGFYIGLQNEILAPMDVAIREGNVFAWLHCLDALHNKISFKMEDGESKEIDGKLRRAETQMSMSTSASRTKGVVLLREVHRTLMKIMDKHQMIFPKIKDVDGLVRSLGRLGIRKDAQKD